MFKKILLRSVAGATAIGSALAFSAVTAPAVVTASPEIRNVACEVKYPGSVSTATQLTLGRSVGVYGVANSATATVSTDEAGAKTPTGRVRFTLSADGKVLRAWTVSLRGGEATVGLPRRLGAQETYNVVARYLPGCSVFKPSTSNIAYYSVNKAGTNPAVNAPNVTRGDNARVNVNVRSASPFAPGGKVRMVVKRHGRVLAKQVRTLRGGKASATFREFAVGRYRVEVRYLGTRNFRPGSGADVFRVTR
jgi:hypothetical protein